MTYMGRVHSHPTRDIRVSQPTEEVVFRPHLEHHSTIPPTTMATKKISSTASTATLDIVDILAGSTLADDSILSTRLSFSSISTSSHSFDDVPPFSLCRQTGPVRLSPSDTFTSIVGHPLPDPLDATDGQCCSDVNPVRPTKLPVEDGTALSPQCTPATSAHAHISMDAAPDNPAHDVSVSIYVPTITISNSSAVLPVSLESSQNLQPELPLAIRRGKKPPPALSLDKSATTNRQSDNDSYPDIQSAFLGFPSPGCQSPTFSFSAGDPSKFTMGLSAMCNSLKALVPPPPFTPTECDPHRPKMEPETRWGMVSSAQLPEVDEDEWAFAQDLVVEWHANRCLHAEISPPPSPAGNLPYAAEVTTLVTGGFSSLATSLPLLSDSSSSESNDEDPSPQTPASVKQLRRKTVIIQAPEYDTDPSVEVEKNGKVQKIELLPTSADRPFALLPDEFDQPVPFEAPVRTQVPALTDGALSPPPSSRPSSTSSAKLPVRGILKEKKSVRFSSVPSLHEYSVTNGQLSEREVSPEQPDAPRPCMPCPGTVSRRHLESANQLGGKHASLTAAPLRSSPLRECYSSGSSRSDGNSSARKHQPYATSPPTTPLPQTPSSDAPGSGTMAKHPAVRALARRPQAYRSAASSCLVGSGDGGAVVGAPGLQPPTPVLLEEQRRAPLKSINVRQRMPIQRTSDILIPVKPASVSVRHASVQGTGTSSRSRQQENVSIDGRGRGARMTARPANVCRGRDENLRTRNMVAKGDACGGAPVRAAARNNSGGSRMPVPLRSILTKLRT